MFSIVHTNMELKFLLICTNMNGDPTYISRDVYHVVICMNLDISFWKLSLSHHLKSIMPSLLSFGEANTLDNALSFMHILSLTFAHFKIRIGYLFRVLKRAKNLLAKVQCACTALGLRKSLEEKEKKK